VCADPNALPYSNERREGFENAIVELVARDLGRPVQYTWWAQRRGFIRNTLRAGLCDVLAGVPAGFDVTLNTHPYYRSTYVFVQRAADTPRVHSLDDPALRRLRIGVQLVGADGVNTPPAHALTARGIVSNVRGYPVYGDYSRARPSWGALNALLENEVDVAVAWGPLAGYFARQAASPIDIVPVAGPIDPQVPFAFDISMGVRRGDRELAAALDDVIARSASEIRQILLSYAVPLANVRQRVQP
jgi:mxaJ protein